MPETQTPPAAPAPAPQSRMQKLRKHYDLHKRKVIILGLLVVLLVVMFNLSPGDHSRDSYQAEPLEFGVVEASPRSIAVDVNSEIEVEFNFAVSAHHAEEFISIYPRPEGRWEQGPSANVIVFKPVRSYYPGSRMEVVLKEGLPSDDGKKLATEYRFEFSINLEGQDMQFQRGTYAYHMTGFSADEGMQFTVGLGSELKEPRAVLYRVPNESYMLQDLAYPTQEARNILYSDYVDYTPPVKDFSQVADYNVKESTNLAYKGDPGIYYLAGFDGDKVVTDTWVMLNRTGVFFRQDDKRIVLAAQNLATGEEVRNVAVNLYAMSGKAGVIRSNIINGISEVAFDYPNRVDLILAKNGPEVIAVPVNLPNSRAEISVYEDLGKKMQVFLYTDRPVYKPGDTVKYRGLARYDNDGIYVNPPTGTKVSVGVYEGTQDKATDPAGVFSGEFTLPTSIPGDYPNSFYSISSRFDDSGYWDGYASYRIASYTKPEYEISATAERAEITKPDRVKVTIGGKYFAGAALKGETVKYTIYARDYYETERAVYNTSFNLNEWGGMCGGGFGIWDEYYGEPIRDAEVRLDQNGQAVVEFDTRDLSSIISQEITVVAEKTDKSGNRLNGAANVIVHAGEFNVFVNTKQYSIDSGEEFSIPFYAETRDGQKLANKPFNYRIYESTWVDGKYGKRDVKSGTASTDADGLGRVTDSVVSSDWGSLFLEVFATDSRNNQVGGSRYLSVTPNGQRNDIDTVLDIVSEKNNLIAGTKAELKIKSPADMRVLVSFERGRIQDPQWLDLKKGDNVFSFDVKDSYMPSITPTFAFFHRGEYFIEGLSLNVPAMKNLINVAIQPDKANYKPGDTARITIKTTNDKNQPVSAQVGAAIVDKAIFALHKSTALPIHSSFYFFRPRQTNASSSMTGIILYPWGNGGGGGGDPDVLSKLVDTLYWNPNLQTNAQGEVTIEVPVIDHLTTWRIQAYASTSDTKVGQSTQDFTVN
jgi:uncharacterized protein YfaS (alpha-2-macroglobulin family)